MKIVEVTNYLESLAPLEYQESYDNSGLIVGDKNAEVTGILLCLDSIEAVVEEALAKECNLVVAHHPIVFSGLKKITGRNYIERTIIKAIKSDVAIYAIHTNLDNMKHGVNAEISKRLGLQNTQILVPKKMTLKKLHTFCPQGKADAVRQAMFAAGAGQIGDYENCSFNVEGTGTFKAVEGANPYVGEVGEEHREAETRIEVVFSNDKQRSVVGALLNAHPYEEVAFDIVALENEHPGIGSGMVGNLPVAMDEMEFLAQLKSTMKAGSVRYTNLRRKKVSRVAVCGGSGSFLLEPAVRSGADVFVTADYKYHQFFDAENRVVIADIGHFESEQFTMDLLGGFLNEKFPKFAVHLSETKTNPINYL